MISHIEISSPAACQPLTGPLKGIVDLLHDELFADAENALAAAQERFAPTTPPSLRYQCLLLTARLRLSQESREVGREALRQALVYGREAGILECVLCQAPDMLAGLCAEALEAGIESEYVQRLIRHSHLQPPSPALSHWPYPVHIYTLGRPAIVIDGQPISFVGKAQKRPMELLYYLVAAGGREVAVPRLLSALWADEDRSVSRSAFDMTLSRLRRLVGVPEAILLHGGRLSLSDRLCWIDIRACERLLGESDADQEIDCSLALLHRALKLYQGDFLAGEEAGWAVLARERLRARLMRSIKRAGQLLEDAGRWPEAARLYDRVRELFPLEEDLCRRLMRSYIEQKEYAQASHLYGRCRELLVKVLGILPSPATVALLDHLPSKPTL